MNIFDELDDDLKGKYRGYIYAYPGTARDLKWLCYSYSVVYNLGYKEVEDLLDSEDRDNIIIAAYILKRLKDEHSSNEQ